MSRCDRCGKEQPREALIYSRHTCRRYCGDFAACDRRAKRSRQQAQAAPLTFTCPVCQLDWPEPFCGGCGAHLSTAPAGTATEAAPAGAEGGQNI